MIKETNYFDLNTKIVISLILINSVSMILYSSGYGFFGEIAGRVMPLLMNLPLFLYFIINVKKFKIFNLNFLNIIFIIYTLYIIINAFYGLFIGNSIYKVLADSFRYLIISLVYLYMINDFNIKNNTINYFKFIIIITQILSFLFFLVMILNGRFSRYSLSVEFLIIYFVFFDKKMNLFLKIITYLFILGSLVLTYTRSGLIVGFLLFIYFFFFYKKRKERIRSLFILITTFILIFIIFLNIPVLNNYYNLVINRFLQTFETIENYFESGLQSTTSYNDTLEDRALENMYSINKMESYNTKLIYLFGNGLGAEYYDYSNLLTGQIHFGPQRDIFKVGVVGLILSNLMYLLYIYYFFKKRKIHKIYEVLLIYFSINYLFYFSFWNFFSYITLIMVYVLISEIKTKDDFNASTFNKFR